MAVLRSCLLEWGEGWGTDWPPDRIHPPPIPAIATIRSQGYRRAGMDGAHALCRNRRWRVHCAHPGEHAQYLFTPPLGRNGSPTTPPRFFCENQGVVAGDVRGERYLDSARRPEPAKLGISFSFRHSMPPFRVCGLKATNSGPWVMQRTSHRPDRYRRLGMRPELPTVPRRLDCAAFVMKLALMFAPQPATMCSRVSWGPFHVILEGLRCSDAGM